MRRFLSLILVVCVIVLFNCNTAMSKKKTDDQIVVLDKKGQPVKLAQAIQTVNENPVSGEKKGGAFAIGTAGNDIITAKWTLVAFDIEALTRFNYESGTGDAETDLMLGAKIYKKFLDLNDVKLNLFISAIYETFGKNERDLTRIWETGNAGRSNIYIRAGLAPEIFINSNFSFEISAGAQLNIIGDSVAGGDGYTQFGTYSSNVPLTAGITFRVYLF
jgi:hypothetical protein